MIDDYAYLWGRPGGRYVLVAFEDVDPPLIWDTELRRAPLIDDDELHAEVTRRMRDPGVPLLDAIP